MQSLAVTDGDPEECRTARLRNFVDDNEKAGQRDIEGHGQSSGVPAAGAMDVGAREPIETRGLHHWREATITKAGLDDRSNVFFAAIEMTRMPMILTDPHLPDNPIVFANKAFLDLTLYEEAEVLGRNCRFLQGAQTDREMVGQLRDAVAANSSVALEILNYRRDGTPFWNAVFIGPVYDSGEAAILLREPARRDSAPRERKGVSAGTENGGSGPAHRWVGPRLQQPSSSRERQPRTRSFARHR
jgi:PAS domain S-box-containing protein